MLKRVKQNMNDTRLEERDENLQKLTIFGEDLLMLG